MYVSLNYNVSTSLSCYDILGLLFQWRHNIVLLARAMAECDYGKLAKGAGPVTILRAVEKLTQKRVKKMSARTFDLDKFVAMVSEGDAADTDGDETPLRRAVRILNCCEHVWCWDHKEKKCVRLSSAPLDCPGEVEVTGGGKTGGVHDMCLKSNEDCDEPLPEDEVEVQTSEESNAASAVGLSTVTMSRGEACVFRIRGPGQDQTGV